MLLNNKKPHICHTIQDFSLNKKGDVFLCPRCWGSVDAPIKNKRIKKCTKI